MRVATLTYINDPADFYQNLGYVCIKASTGNQSSDLMLPVDIGITTCNALKVTLANRVFAITNAKVPDSLKPDDFYLTYNGLRVDDDDVVQANVGLKIVVRGRGGAKTLKKDGALKTKLYKNTKQVEANNIKEIALARGQKVLPSVLQGHPSMAQLMMKVDGLLGGSSETSGSVILQEVVKCCNDANQLKLALESIDTKKSRTCSIDTRIRAMAKHIGGAELLHAVALKESLDALLDAYQSGIHHAFLKAQSEDEKFDIGSMKRMIEYQMAFLHGRSSSSSTPVVPDVPSGADEVADALQNMSVG
eukprot:Skav207089  [mRNA]  locus=scaffold1067:42485:43399:- [translate_table: standard]